MILAEFFSCCTNYSILLQSHSNVLQFNTHRLLNVNNGSSFRLAIFPILFMNFDTLKKKIKMDNSVASSTFDNSKSKQSHTITLVFTNGLKKLRDTKSSKTDYVKFISFNCINGGPFLKKILCNDPSKAL